MRIKTSGKDLEFRVQERRVVTCTVFHKGEEVASGEAVCAPGDQFDLRAGQEIAVARAAHDLYLDLTHERDMITTELDEILTAAGAISAEVEFEPIETPEAVAERVMGKLAERAIKAAKKLTLEELKELVKTLDGVLRPPFLPFFPSVVFIPPNPPGSLG